MNKVFGIFGLRFDQSSTQFNTPFPGAEEVSYSLHSGDSSKWQYSTHPVFELDVGRLEDKVRIDFNANLTKNKHKLQVGKRAQEDWESSD